MMLELRKLWVLVFTNFPRYWDRNILNKTFCHVSRDFWKINLTKAMKLRCPRWRIYTSSFKLCQSTKGQLLSSISSKLLTIQLSQSGDWNKCWLQTWVITLNFLKRIWCILSFYLCSSNFVPIMCSESAMLLVMLCVQFWWNLTMTKWNKLVLQEL